MNENQPEDARLSAELLLVQVGEDSRWSLARDVPSRLEVQPILATPADRAQLHEAPL